MIARLTHARVMASIAFVIGISMVPSTSSATVVSYEMLNGFQSAWTGIFDVPSLATPIGTSTTANPTVTAVTAVDSTVSWSFAPSSYSLGPTSDIGPFVQWGGQLRRFTVCDLFPGLLHVRGEWWNLGRRSRPDFCRVDECLLSRRQRRATLY